MQAKFEWQRSKKGKTKNNNNNSDIEITSSFSTRTPISSQGTGVCHRKPISWILLGNQSHHRFIYFYRAIWIHDIDEKKKRARKKRWERLPNRIQWIGFRWQKPVPWEDIGVLHESANVENDEVISMSLLLLLFFVFPFLLLCHSNFASTQWLMSFAICQIKYQS